MPYMDMNPKIRIGLGIMLFLVNFTISALIYDMGMITNVLSCTTIPFVIYVIPGVLYYKYLCTKDKTKSYHKIASLFFSALGVLFILAYNTISLSEDTVKVCINPNEISNINITITNTTYWKVIK